jgi:hypothetical protein
MSNKYDYTPVVNGEISTADVTVSGGATLLTPNPVRGRKDFVLQNLSGGDIWLGGPAVTQYDGIKVSTDGVFSLQLGRGDLYAVTSGATVSGVRVMEVA